MRLIAIDLTGHDAELVADRCWQAGAAGLWEVDASTLRAGVDDDEADAFLRSLADLDPRDVTEAEAVELAAADTTVTVAGRDISLHVPPTVFGDGHHPTTATCLDLLPSLVGPGMSVLDVGCGAGALSVAAALLGAEVTAVDVDPAAVRATADNARANGAAVAASETPLRQIDGSFEVVLANLTVGGLRPLVDDLVRVTAPGGSVVLSGMLEHQWPAIRRAAGGHVGDVRAVDGWITAVVRRSGS